MTALCAMAILLLAPPELNAGDETIPLEPISDQSVTNEAIFLVEQYGALAVEI